MNVPIDFDAMLQSCAPAVHASTMRRLVEVESSFNPYAIGVVGARLQRQPRTYQEALATIIWLHAKGYNYSVGLAQINRYNFSTHGLTPASALLACPNLAAGAAILTDCFRRANSQDQPQAALRAAFSCYESGNFTTGFRDGYVQKIVAPQHSAVARTPHQAQRSNVARAATEQPGSDAGEPRGTAPHLRTNRRRSIP
ncbi:lytic transglycosylase domain-containing protein [Massilia sp. R2A-15]|uniref:lytic transglycosylase domain-containing protein n=1 Tax=Massilia sp. R2A-15 TaxID=3064278 RepID=UPI002735A030|nr:lytic transglycosylase domain-containing protein [Massilia sp. R2A-15]WLI91086.1 lytic transglycosylase domain-containing protein [Massilia sp. R2A-15]